MNRNRFKLIDEWNNFKKEIAFITMKELIGLKNREIWWCSVGMNVGQETYGKGNNFSRPVLIIKRLSSQLCFALPLTTKPHTGDWYYKFTFRNKTQYVMLNQLRVFHANRLGIKIGRINHKDFLNIKKKLKHLLEL